MNSFIFGEVIPAALEAGISFLKVLPILLGCTAYLTLFERKVMAAMQLRKGPNVNGPAGLFQPIMDGVKLLLKEPIAPKSSNFLLFLLAPIIVLGLSIFAWAFVPLREGSSAINVNVGILYIFAISSLSVYGVIIAGWSSGSSYPFLGAIRSTSQMISYELSMGTILLCVVMFTSSLDLSQIVHYQAVHGWLAIKLFPLFILFLICIIAETNRHPFDLPEAESELVAGFNVEYSSTPFAAFFLGEYANMILVSAITTILFLGGWLAPIQALSFIPGPAWFALKVISVLFVFVWVRASLPRYRFDQLIRLGWNTFLPLSVFALFVCAFVVYLPIAGSSIQPVVSVI